MEQRTREDLAARGAGEVVYCVVPPRLARITPRLCEHFADDADVEVVVDQRAGERREADASELAERLVPGLERRAIDGRRGSVPIRELPLPPELRRYEKDLTFLAAPAPSAESFPEARDSWRDRCLAAEQQARSLAGTLIATTDALRSRRGMSPQRYLEVARAEAALERYRRWRTPADGPG